MAAAERKLTAVLSADVVGYSRLMAEDDEATLQALRECRELVARVAVERRGRVVDDPGDNLLAEFRSALDAVQAAIEIQRALERGNEILPEARRMRLRIGVHLGDVLAQEGRLYGDGVNIAARLEPLADPGGICISGSVYEQVHRRLDVECEPLGEQRVKNIPEPVRAFRLALEGGSGGAAGARTRLVAAIAAPSLLAAGALAWWLGLVGSRTAVVPVAGPEEASIVVLPFANLSEDSGQEYFSDGITEALITELSRLPDLAVIARTSAFSYKGRSVPVQQIADELDVQYVVEGSVQKSRDRVRIAAQLIDAETGRHLWAERYDRRLEDLFALQDEVTSTISRTLELQVEWRARHQLAEARTRSPEAYDHYLRASALLVTHLENLPRAREHLERALELDPNFADAWAALSYADFIGWIEQWSDEPAGMERALDHAERAIALDPNGVSSHILLARALLHSGQSERAIATAEAAVRLAPGRAGAHEVLGEALQAVGRTGEALHQLRIAKRLDPRSPWADFHLGAVLCASGAFAEAISLLERATEALPALVGARLALAAAYEQGGDHERAREQVGEVRRLVPSFSLEEWVRRMRLLDPASAAPHLEALRRAGLGEDAAREGTGDEIR